ncbi:MAG: hypothetical protein RI935_297 [Candidatus Parcubacteria bacterium]|jgi:mRNA-degrading endonuclease RelE of RelBE toxin-antitoxin system
MLEVRYTEEFLKRFKDLPLSIQKKAAKQIDILKVFPFYPSLHNEKIEPTSKGLWSIRIDQKYRILYRHDEGNVVVLLSCGAHDWLYSVSKFFK